uniref:Uncharacterized protein n=1 Tax=Anopheles culicifacies TaxID=139723 RepID=A0A182MUZ8_9DIPT
MLDALYPKYGKHFNYNFNGLPIVVTYSSLPLLLKWSQCRVWKGCVRCSWHPKQHQSRVQVGGNYQNYSSAFDRLPGRFTPKRNPDPPKSTETDSNFQSHAHVALIINVITTTIIIIIIIGVCKGGIGSVARAPSSLILAEGGDEFGTETHNLFWKMLMVFRCGA